MGTELRQTDTGGLRTYDDLSGGGAGVVRAMRWLVARGATNTAIIDSLPANAHILRIDVTVPVVSNATTTATVSVGLNGGSATFFSAAQDVKTAVGNFSQATTAGWAVSSAPQIVNCTYTETGTASSAGTAYVALYYVTL